VFHPSASPLRRARRCRRSIGRGASAAHAVRLLIAVVGRPRAEGLATAITDYESRAARYWPLEVAEVREGGGGASDPQVVRAREGERLLERVAGTRTVVCDRDGSRRTSEEFARWMQQIRESGRDAAFVIGGSFGLSDAVREGAWERLSLAPWTLPHEMARLVLAEQLYRAGTIVRGEPYHK
jgi:23S rRNA (pseudouridine1915-N3)-methyltransferase